MAEVQTKTVEATTVMSLPFTGPYEQTWDKMDHLMSWLLRVGHPYSGLPFALYYDDPGNVAADDLRAEVCLPIDEQCDPADDVQRKAVPEATVAYALYTGPYEGIEAFYEEMFAWIRENDRQYVEGEPTREVFHQLLGHGEDPEECIIEVQVPIEQG